MTAQEIKNHFPSWTPVIFSDASYGKPTTAWIRDKFWPWFQKQRFDLGLHKWDRRSDCDDFALHFVSGVRTCHALTAGNQDEGIAIGMFYYHATSHVQGPHAIVVAFTEEGKVFFEPQNGQRLALTPSEEQSCFFALF